MLKYFGKYGVAKVINFELLEAFNKYKAHKGHRSDASMCREFGIHNKTYSALKNGRQEKLADKDWRRIRDRLKPFIKPINKSKTYKISAKTYEDIQNLEKIFQHIAKLSNAQN